MTEKRYDTVILGATFLGFGAALSMKGKTAIVESGGLFGAEFVDCFKLCHKSPVRTVTEKGTEFAEDLKRRKLINELGEIYPAPTIYVLSSLLKNRPMDILLMTEVISIKRQSGCYEITIFNTQGFCTITAGQILDTTTFGKGHTEGQEIPRLKSLNAILYNSDGNDLENLHYNSMNGLYYYHMPVTMDMSRYDALEMLCRKEKEFLEKNIRISTIAQAFAYEMEPVVKRIGEQFVWIPSAAYHNLVEAFDAGAWHAANASNVFYALDTSIAEGGML